MKKLRLLYLFFFFIKSYSQISYHADSLSSYSIERFSSDNGQLPQNSIKSIVKDKFGFVWLTTDGGLVRYDGQKFLTYKTDKSQENRGTYIEGTSKGNFLYTFLDNDVYMSVIQDRDNKIVKITNKQLYVSHVYRLLGTVAASGNIFNFMVDDKRKYVLNNYWLYYYNNNKQVFRTKLPDHNFLNYFLHNDTLYYFKNNKNIEKIDHKGNSIFLTTNLPTDVPYVFINNLPNQQLFIATKNKILLADHESGNQLIFKTVY